MKKEISYLADHQDLIPVLASWFYQEWGNLYPERTLRDFEAGISERVNKDKIPVNLLAFHNKELIGTVCLKDTDMDTRPELTPWLAGLYV